MQAELRELIKDAPPARYDVEDVLAAGRRRQRRQRAGWAIAAVTVVAVAIGVPQILTRPAPKAPVAPAPMETGPWPFEVSFTGWADGNLSILEPAAASLNGARGVVVLDGRFMPGSLIMYAPGIDPSSVWAGEKITAADPIGGRPAFFTGPSDGSADRRLVWRYADDAVAVITATDGMLTRDGMHRLAATYRASAARPVLLPFRVGWVPDGYRLIEVGGGRGQQTMMGHALLASPDVVTERIADPATDIGRPDGSLSIQVQTGAKESDEIVCQEVDHTCRVGIDGRELLTVTGPRSIPLADLRRVLTSVELVDPWLPASGAFPASAQVTR